jgi:hypothetical protein
MTGWVVVLAWPVLTIATAIGLDWRRHQVGSRWAKGKACVLCGRPALMRDEAGRPCHKVCAERDRGYAA